MRNTVDPYDTATEFSYQQFKLHVRVEVIREFKVAQSRYFELF